MNDMELLRDVADQSPLLSLAEMSAAEDRLMARITQERQVVEQRHGAHPRASRESRLKQRRGFPRRIVIGGVAGAAAAAITAGVLAAGSDHAARPLAAQLAREVLDSAAHAALLGPAVVPRPDQFVYTQVTGYNGVVVKTWQSVDGSRDGLSVETKGDHRPVSQTLPSCASRVLQGNVYQCRRPQPAFYPDMPTNASAMSGFLQKHGKLSAAHLNQLADTVGDMLETDYFLPSQRAAMYEFLATVPGLTVERNVHDVTGRPGVGVTWPTGQGSQWQMLVFDPRTHVFLGMQYLKGQATQSGSALEQVAITNQAGQLP